MKESQAIHICRNPHGWSAAQIREARLEVCRRLEDYKEAYLNMRDFAESKGLDTVARIQPALVAPSIQEEAGDGDFSEEHY